MEILASGVDSSSMYPLVATLVFSLVFSIAAPASAQESALRLTRPHATGATSRALSRRPSRRQRRRRLRLSLALAAGLGTAFSMGVAELAARHRGGPCALPQPDLRCDRARLATGIGSFVAASLLVTPLALWAAGQLHHARGGYVMPWLMTGVGLMVGGLGLAMTRGLARRAWGRRLGYGVSALMPASFGALGYLARDVERRRFGGLAFTPRRAGASLGYVGRF